ncbi:MAG TPA: DUF6058 family natural product biosynthesis protein [Gaiellaceae bacterium]|nr:DUF6058 family natural product biosynthesis protein [Gaiellaceae bacterium]
MLSDADIEYVRREFTPLADLCMAQEKDLDEVRAAIAMRRLAGFPYPGMEYVPANYFDLPDADEFRQTFAGPDVDAELDAYLDGTYFVCVREATVENIARKEQLVTEIRRLLAELRPLVDELDALERPFSPDYDRQRFGVPPTRDELITPFRSVSTQS